MTGIPKGTKLSVLSEELLKIFSPEDGWNAEFEADADDGYVVISAPADNGLIQDIPQWSLMMVHYTLGAVSYVFCAQLVKQMAEGHLLMLRLTSDVIRNQRRSGVRLEVVRSITGVSSRSGNVTGTFSGLVMDVGVGGLSLRTDTELSRGDQVKIMMPGEDGEQDTELHCETRWIMRLEEDAGHKYTVGMLFLFPHQVDKDRFTRYIKRLQYNRVAKFRS